MDKRNNNIEPWDPDFYETGSTEPPKSHGTLVAVLLMSVIILCGFSSALGLLKLQDGESVNGEDTQSPISFRSDDPSGDPALSTTGPLNGGLSTEPDTTVGLETSPQSVDNVPQAGGLSLQDIYAQTIDSVTSITCTLAAGTSSGTGVVVSGDGYVVTNAHVVENARTISVSLTDGRTLEATLVGADKATDLAVLHIDGEDLAAAVFGDSSMLRVGDTVVAIGDPLGLELRGTMTDGIVSAINRDITVDGRTMTLIQTNAALNSGNSGGPLLNCYGQVIGINTMKIGDYMNSSGVEGLGFAIPSTTVKTIVDQLISQGYVSGRPRLGITIDHMSGIYQRYYGLPTSLYIAEVEAGSPADLAGIQPGDVLVSFEGQALSDTDTLSNMLYSYEAGDTVTIVIYRNGRQYAVELVLGEVTG